MSGIWLLVPVFLPVLLGIFFPCFSLWKIQKQKTIMIGASLVACGSFCIFYLLFGKNLSLDLWKLTDTITLSFSVDGIGKMFAILTTFVWVLVGFYTFDYMKQDEESGRFFRFYLMVYGILMGLDFSGNLVTSYLFFEMMTLASLPLVLHDRTKEAILAGLKYLFYSIAGAFLGLLSIFFFYHYQTNLSYVPGGIFDSNVIAGKESVLLFVSFLAIIGFGCKAGMFPLHAWLPSAHPVAPSPASAVLSGIITKSGVLCIIRVIFYIVGVDFLRGTYVQYAFLGLSLFTVFLGSMLAYLEPLLKKRLAYSSVSQISYALFGISLLHPIGVLGALLHVIFHAIIKSMLFLSAGAIIEQTGCRRVDELVGIGKRMPKTMAFFTICGLALVGVPPLSGFLSKWYLASGSLDSSLGFLSWFGPVILLVSALLTAGYLLPISLKGFLPGESNVVFEEKEANAMMTIPMAILTLATIVLGIFSSPLVDALNKIIDTII